MFVQKAAALVIAAISLSANAQQAPSEPQLAEANQLASEGKFSQAEARARQFLAGHTDSAAGHRLLGYILFKENDPKGSLSEYFASAHTQPLGAPEFEVMGCDYFLLEDYRSADTWLTRSVESGNKSGLALYLLGRAKYNERQFDQAVEYFTQSLSVQPGDVKARLYLGQTYEQMGHLQDALAAYRTAVASSDKSLQKDPEPYLALGTLLIEENQAHEAVQYLVSAAASDPNNATVHRELGKAYLQIGELGKARPELEQACHLEPENAAGHFLLAEDYSKLGFRNQAEAEQARFRELTGAHSSSDDPLSEARSLVEKGNLDSAEQIVRRYLELHKNSSSGYFLLGYLLFERREAKNSLAAYTEGAQYHTPSARDLEVVGDDYVLLHDYADADKWFAKSLEMDPGNWQVLYYLGRTKYNENRFDEAVKVFEQCLVSQPKSVKAEDNLGLSLEGLGKNEEAIAAYKTAIGWEAASAVRDEGPYLDLGALLVTTDRATEAVPFLRSALQLAPADVRVHRQLGKAYFKLGQLTDAQRELEKSVQLAPDYAPTHFALAQLYERMGRTAKAQQEIDRYRALGATHSVGEQ